jgi:hypothetical protein
VRQAYQHLIGDSLDNTMATAFLRAAVVIPTAFLIAMASKRFLEDPCLRLKDKLFPAHT